MAMEISARAATVRRWPADGLAKRLPALLFGAHGIAILDQLVVSGTSFLSTVLIGRAAGAAELGSYAVAVSVFASIMAMQNALILLPFAIQQHRAEHGGEAHAGGAFALSGGLALLAALATAMSALGLALAGGAAATQMLSWAIAAMLPFILVREFARRFAFARLRTQTALAIDAAVSAIQLGGLGAMAWSGRLDAVSACLCFGFACGVPALAWAAATRREFQFLRPAVTTTARESWRLGKWLMLGQITVQIQSYGAYWLIMGLGGAAATGVFAACMSLVGFANPLLFGVANVLTPKQALAWRSGGSAGLLREAVRNALLLGCMIAAFCLLLAVTGEQLLHVLFHGDDYAGYGHVVTVLALATLATAIGMPASNALAAMERPRAIVVVGGFGVIVTVATMAVLMLRWGLLGAAYGDLAGSAVGAVGRWLAFLAVARKAQADAPVDPAVLRLAGAGDDAHVERLGEGDFAAVFAVAPAQGGERVVLKLYRDGCDPGLAQEQYDALARLHACLDGREAEGWTVRVPRPIAVSQAPRALAMTAVSGRPLESGLIDDETARSAGRAFACAMQAAWAQGLLHGDLHLNNVLIDSEARTLSLIDPGPGVSCEACNAAHLSAAARDLGHLVGELATDVNDMIGDPAARLQKQNFVAAVLQNARACPVEEVREGVLWHLDAGLRPSWSPRGLWHRLIRIVAERRSDDLLGRMPACEPAQEAPACSHR
jgi:O-antigen/teichoic acid export membrane protein